MANSFETVEPYLKGVKLAAIASCADNKPWCATVFFAYDKELNFYFLSQTHRRHSKNVVKNPKVSMAIADQSFEFGDKVKGVQLEGECVALSGNEAKKAFDVYKKRFLKAGKLVPLDLLVKLVNLLSPNEHRIWKVKHSKIKVFDEEKYGSEGKEFLLS